MNDCYCCGIQFNESAAPPKFCGSCGAAAQIPTHQIDSEEGVESYRALLAEYFFDLSQSNIDESLFIKYRARLRISLKIHNIISDQFKAQRRVLESIGGFTVEFDENVNEAYAGNDTYLRFRFTNNSDELLRVKFFWDDPETDDNFDFNIESKSFVKPKSSIILGGSHVFSRIGIKEISDLLITVCDPYQQVKFRASPITFKVNNPDQRVTQHITTHNQISIEGRGVVDASGMGSERGGPALQPSNDPKWIRLSLTFVPSECQSEEGGKAFASNSQAKASIVTSGTESNFGLDSGFDERDIESVRRASSQNNLAAINALATAYSRGEAVEQDYAQAFELFMQAATQGYAPSQVNLGQMYELGSGVAINLSKASEWYLKAAEQKQRVGLFKAARCYLYGQGLPQNEVRAKELCELSISLGYVPANALLGDMYANGLAVIKDSRLAAEYYLKAALGGDDYGQLMLASMYHSGDSLPADLNLAIRWYREAASQGNLAAQYGLAKLYLTEETHRDEKLAASLIKQSAEKGYSPSQALLGTLYRFGTGVPQDFAQARHWLQLASAQGDDEAASELESLDATRAGGGQVDCNCPAMDEALTYLDSCFDALDTGMYGESETLNKNWHRDYRISDDLESVFIPIIEQNTGWKKSEFFGVLFENVNTIQTDDNFLIVNFDGFANLVYKSGVATVSVVNNQFIFNEAFEWHDGEVSEFCLWINECCVYLGSITKNIYRWGGQWLFVDDDLQSVQQTVTTANSWIARIFAIAKGEVDGQQVLYAADADNEKALENEDENSVEHIELSDGSTWSGELDSNGMLVGFGTWSLANGDRYEGYCENGRLHGEGTYYWLNGEIYSGHWANGKRHGYGVDIFPDGSRREGNWVDDVFVENNQTSSRKGLISSFVDGFKSGYRSSTD